VLGVQQSGPQLVADRYAYLAGIPLAWLLGGALWWALRRDPVTRRAGLIAAGLVLVGVATLTFRQSQIWRDSETLWTVAYAHAPEAPLASLNLGLAIADRARQMPDPELRARELDRALALVRAAAARRPSMGLYAMNEAILMSTRAQPPGGEVDSALLEQAIERGAAAIAVAEAQSLSDASWYWHQGRMLVASGRPEPAIHSFEQALSRRPDWPPARIALAGALLESALRSGEEDSERALLRVSRALGVLAPLPESTTDVQRLRAGALELRAVLIDERRGAHASPPGL
jgi:tetratricopeptide (TPR) repeat protein